MKIKALFLEALLVAMASAPVWADGTPAWMRDNQLNVGFAVGKGFVDRSDSEIAAFQYRIEFRKKRIYIAHRGSWVAQDCNSRPNPTELSLLAGLSLPGYSPRDRIHIGMGVGITSLWGAALSLPLELRVNLGVLALTAFSNINRMHSFHGICAGLEFPLRIFKE